MITAYPGVRLPDCIKHQPMPAYSIFGWFEDPKCGGVAVPFSGHIRLDKTNGTFEGRLGDMYGESEISGTLTPTKLHFEKKYRRNGYTVQDQCDRDPGYSYRFSIAGDEWIGSYGSGTSHGPYQAACVLTLVCEDAALMVWDK